MMKRIAAILLSVVMLFTGCAQPDVVVESASPVPEETVQPAAPLVWHETVPQYDTMSDQGLHRYIEDVVYSETVAALDSEEYFVEDVQTVYMSKEYLEEVAFNSQKNVYFGYTLDELDQVFQGKKYIFTLGENGETVVEELDEIQDNTAGEILQNVMVGSGVILVCVTVSTVTVTQAPAVSMIFAVSAKSAAILAGSSAALGGISSGIERGIQTGDFDEAMKAAALSASEEFKWGAITGAISGGTGELIGLKSATHNGLTMNDAAKIQRDSHWPLDSISEMHSMKEYQVYKDAGLKPVRINGKTALVQDVDLDFKSQLPDGTDVTNLERMKRGYAPIDPQTGKSYQLHHIGQKENGTLAILKEEQHQGNSSILNIPGKESEIDRNKFTAVRKAFWEGVAKTVQGSK